MIRTKTVGRPPLPFPCAEAEVRVLLATQTLRVASALLGVSPSQGGVWRRRLGIPNPHLPHSIEHTGVPAAKGLTWAAIEAALLKHPEGLHPADVARLVGCSRQAVHEKFLRLERRGLVVALHTGYKRRSGGWVLAEKKNEERGHNE